MSQKLSAIINAAKIISFRQDAELYHEFLIDVNGWMICTALRQISHKIGSCCDYRRFTTQYRGTVQKLTVDIEGATNKISNSLDIKHSYGDLENERLDL